MDDVRRKFVLGSSLFTVGMLSGCGGGGDAGADATRTGQDAGGRLSAQAVSPSGTAQTLLLTELTGGAGLDTVWQSTWGGAYVVPSVVPKWQAVVNGNALYLSVVETVQVNSSVKLIRNLTVTLDNGGVPVVNSAYTLSRNTALTLSSARMAVLKRVTAPSTGAISEELYVYQNDSVASGVVTIAGVTPTTPDITDGPAAAIYKLHFAGVKFLRVPGSLSSKGFWLNGDTTLQAATETRDWM